MPYTPRPYQAELVIHGWRDLCQGRNSIVVLPTGCGKTLTACLIIDTFVEVEQNLVIFVCPTISLAQQQRTAIKKQLPHRNVTDPEAISQAHVIVGTAGAIRNAIENSGKEKFQNALLVLDECHQSRGDSDYMHLLQKRSVCNMKLLGLTATPFPSVRDLGRILNATCRSPVAFFEDLQELSRPVPMVWSEVKEQSPVLKKSFEEFPQAIKDVLDSVGPQKALELHEKMSGTKKRKSTPCYDPTEALSPKMTAALKEIKTSNRAKTILFCSSRLSSYCACEVLKEHGIKAGTVLGGNNVQSKANLLKFRNNELDVIVATTVAEEGLDISACSLVIRIDIIQSWSGLIQSHGRIRNRADDVFPKFVAVGEKTGQMRWNKLQASIEKVKRELSFLKEEQKRHENLPQISRLVGYMIEHIEGGGTAGEFFLRHKQNKDDEKFETHAPLRLVIYCNDSSNNSLIQCALIFGQVMNNPTGDCQTPLGCVDHTNIYGDIITHDVIPADNFCVTPPLIKKALAVAPRFSLLELDSSESDYSRGSVRQWQKSKPIMEWQDLSSSSFGLLPSIDSGFCCMLDVGGYGVQLKEGGRIDVRYSQVDREPWDELGLLQFMRFLVSDLALPAIVDHSRVYLTLRHAPRFYEEETDGKQRKTRTRIFPPRQAGIGLALTLCLQFKSASVVFKQFIPALRRYGTRVLHSSLKETAQDSPVKRYELVARQFCDDKLFPYEQNQVKLRSSKAGKSSSKTTGSREVEFFQFLSLFGQQPHIASSSHILSPKLWELSKNFGGEFCTIIADHLQAQCYIPLEVLIKRITEDMKDCAKFELNTTTPSITMTPSASFVKEYAENTTDSRGIRRYKEYCQQHYNFQPTVLPVYLRDEDGAGLSEDMAKTVVKNLWDGKLQLELSNSIEVLWPFHWSMSMLRNGSLFVANEPKAGAVQHFLDAHILQNCLKEESVAKRASRVALFFSKTELKLCAPKSKPFRWKKIEDVERNSFCFTDGAGLIDADVLRSSWQGGKVPSAILIRMLGAKGVLQKSEGLKEKFGYDALLCESMVKIPLKIYHTDKIFVCSFSRRLPLYLNHQVMLLLLSRGIKMETFDELFQDELIRKMRPLLQPKESSRRLTEMKSPFLPQALNLFKRKHFDPRDHYFFRKLLAFLFQKDNLDLRSRGRVFLPKGAIMMGVPDFTKTLKPGEVFINLSSCPEADGTGVICGKLIVTKNPCCHPGDIRIVEGVDVEELRGLKDVIVFSVMGQRPTPDQISGSDLDGDLYWVCWDERLCCLDGSATGLPIVDDFGNVQAMDYEAKEATDPPTDKCDYFYRAVSSSSKALGKISICHKLHADKKGAASSVCLSLAQLASDAVDSPKTGVKVEIPQEHRFPKSKRPKWSVEDDDPSADHDLDLGYEIPLSNNNNTPLQKVFNRVSEFSQRCGDFNASFIADPTIPQHVQLLANHLMEFGEWKVLEETANNYRSMYHKHMRCLMRRFGCLTEAECISCDLLRHRGSTAQDRKAFNVELAAGLERLRYSVEKMFRMELERKEAASLAKQALLFSPKIQPAHVIALIWFMVAHLSPIVIGDKKSKRDFVSFGWIASMEFLDLHEVLQSQNSFVPMTANPIIQSISEDDVGTYWPNLMTQISIIPTCAWGLIIPSVWLQRIHYHHSEKHVTFEAKDFFSLLLEARFGAKVPLQTREEDSKESLGERHSKKGLDEKHWKLIQQASYDNGNTLTQCLLKILVASNHGMQVLPTFVAATAALAFSPKTAWKKRSISEGVKRERVGDWPCCPNLMDGVESNVAKEISEVPEISIRLDLRPTHNHNRTVVYLRGSNLTNKQFQHLKELAIKLCNEACANSQTFQGTYFETSCKLEPDVQRKIVEGVNENNVLLIEGPTGSGKSSLVPVLLHEKVHLGRFTRIAVAQPRRVACVSLAQRVALIKGWKVGKEVGYHIGGDCQEAAGMRETSIVFMTNSILMQILLSSQQPPFTHILLDEIHIRSRYDDINMDLIVKMISTNPWGLKLVLMSATANSGKLIEYTRERNGLRVQRVSLPSTNFTVKELYLRSDFYAQLQRRWQEEGFELPTFPACRMQPKWSLSNLAAYLVARGVSGAEGYVSYQGSTPRQYDWTVYLIAECILWVNRKNPGSSTVLCFLPGEPEIKRVEEWMKFLNPRLEVKVVIGRHTVESQAATLSGEQTGRVIVLASDVVESCVTPSNVEIVVDCLQQKRINPESQSLTLQYISRAEAQQRAGRAGRLRDGKVYRLASKSFFDNLQAHPRPEMECSGLEDLLLQLVAHSQKKRGSGSNSSFGSGPDSISGISSEGAQQVLADLIEPPSVSSIKEAIQMLKEVRALKGNQQALQLTILGHLLQFTHIDPRHALFLLNGYRFGCLPHSIAIIALTRTSREIFNTNGPFPTIRQYQQAALKRESATKHGNLDLASDLFALLQMFYQFHKLRANARHSEADVLAWCKINFLSYNGLVEASGYFEDTIKILHKQRWIDVEEAKELQTPISPDADDLMLLRAILVMTYPHLVVRQRIKLNPRVPERAQRDWNKKLKFNLRTRRPRRQRSGRRNEQVNGQYEVQKLVSNSSITQKNHFVLAEFASSAECLSHWRRLMNIPTPRTAFSDISTNVAYEYKGALHSLQQRDPRIASSFACPSPHKDATFVASKSLKLSQENLLLFHMTELPSNWAQQQNLDKILYAFAAGEIVVGENLQIMCQGKEVIIQKPSEYSNPITHSFRRLLIEEEGDFSDSNASKRTAVVQKMKKNVKRRRGLFKEMIAKELQNVGFASILAGLSRR